VIIHRGLSKEIKKELKAHLNEKFPGIDIRFTYPRRIKIARKLGLTKYRRWQIEAGKKFQIS
jgi:hypothetical protein